MCIRDRLWDIKQFYADEFAIGLYSLRLIEEKLGVTLPEDEACLLYTSKKQRLRPVVKNVWRQEHEE